MFHKFESAKGESYRKLAKGVWTGALADPADWGPKCAAEAPLLSPSQGTGNSDRAHGWVWVDDSSEGTGMLPVQTPLDRDS